MIVLLSFLTLLLDVAQSMQPFLVALSSGPGLSCELTSSAADGHIEVENGPKLLGRRSCWLLRPNPAASHITLSFRRFLTELNYDVLHIFDGHYFSPSALPCSGNGNDTGCRLTPLAGLSGNISPATMVAHSGAILLIFETDLKLHGPASGFTFAWTSSDGSRLPMDHCAPRCSVAMKGNGQCEQPCYNGGCEWDDGDCDRVCDMATGAMCNEIHPNPGYQGDLRSSSHWPVL